MLWIVYVYEGIYNFWVGEGICVFFKFGVFLNVSLELK